MRYRFYSCKTTFSILGQNDPPHGLYAYVKKHVAIQELKHFASQTNSEEIFRIKKHDEMY